ncbi:MAG: exopolyphosphatase, partial [Eubacterium sp.]|nr:exopolyphosphatase [Eubacterium sp.]
MAVTTYAAIDIGSYDLTLEIFEISAKNGIHCINKLRHRLELGRGTFSVGRIAPEMVDELCNVLRDFRSVMKEYKVDSYDAIATSAIREAQNDLFVLGRIRQLTGLEVRILSNSEQRFLSYKAIASIEGRFKEMIQKGTVVIDLDGGSIQISIFDNSELIQTANMRMGSMRIRERLQAATAGNNDYDELVRELIHEDLDSFSKMYLKNRKIENIILNGDFITEMIFRDPKHRDRSTRMLTRDSFEKWYRKIAKKSVADLAINNNIAMEYASLLRPSAILYHL